MTQKLRYRAFEKELVQPFSTFDSWLTDCRVMVSTSEGFVETNNIYLTEDTDCCQLELKVDVGILSSIDRDQRELVLAVFHRDFDGVKLISKIFEKNFVDLEYHIVDLEPLLPSSFFGSGAEISISVINKNSGNGFERLAKKTFKFLSFDQSLKFPKYFRTPEDFVQAGFASSTPFAVKWIGEDMDRPINQLVELWLNADHRLALETFALSEQEFSKSMMAATILGEVFYWVILKSIETNNFDATASKSVFGLLEKNSVSREELISVSESPDFRSIVCSFAMQTLKMHEGLINEFG